MYYITQTKEQKEGRPENEAILSFPSPVRLFEAVSEVWHSVDVCWSHHFIRTHNTLNLTAQLLLGFQVSCQVVQAPCKGVGRLQKQKLEDNGN